MPLRRISQLLLLSIWGSDYLKLKVSEGEKEKWQENFKTSSFCIVSKLVSVYIDVNGFRKLDKGFLSLYGRIKWFVPTDISHSSGLVLCIYLLISHIIFSTFNYLNDSIYQHLPNQTISFSLAIRKKYWPVVASAVASSYWVAQARQGDP